MEKVNKIPSEARVGDNHRVSYRNSHGQLNITGNNNEIILENKCNVKMNLIGNYNTIKCLSRSHLEITITGNNNNLKGKGIKVTSVNGINNTLPNQNIEDKSQGDNEQHLCHTNKSLPLPQQQQIQNGCSQDPLCLNPKITKPQKVISWNKVVAQLLRPKERSKDNIKGLQIRSRKFSPKQMRKFPIPEPQPKVKKRQNYNAMVPYSKPKINFGRSQSAPGSQSNPIALQSQQIINPSNEYESESGSASVLNFNQVGLLSYAVNFDFEQNCSFCRKVLNVGQEYTSFCDFHKIHQKCIKELVGKKKICQVCMQKSFREQKESQTGI